MRIHHDERDDTYNAFIDIEDNPNDILENLLNFLFNAKIVDAMDFYVKCWGTQWSHTDKSGKTYPF